jgi:hypothetical protein
VKNAKTFGELFITHVENFTWHWDDEGSGGKLAVSFWHPNAPTIPEGYKALGTVALPAWGSDNLPTNSSHKVKEHTVAVCVRENPDVPSPDGKPALADPVDYAWVWSDKGTGSKYAEALWRPVAPEGYVAMGLVASKDSYDKPPLDAVTCVREDLTYRAEASEKPVYKDTGTGGKHDLSVWRNSVPSKYVDSRDSARVLLSPNTYTAHTSYDRPRHLPDMHVLCLPLPSEKSKTPTRPALEDRDRPAGQTPEALVGTVWVPFTAVKDEDRSTEWKLANSPFYRIERKVSWSLLSFINNDTDTAQSVTDTVTTGIEKETIDTFSVNTGFSYSGNGGFSIGVISASVTTTFSLELGFSRSKSSKELESHSVARTLQVPAKHAGAMWVGTSTLQVTRGDKSLVAEPLIFHDNNFHYDQFPDATTPETEVKIPQQVVTAPAQSRSSKPTAGAGKGSTATKRS